MAGFTGLPISLPGTSYTRALDARGETKRTTQVVPLVFGRAAPFEHNQSQGLSQAEGVRRGAIRRRARRERPPSVRICTAGQVFATVLPRDYVHVVLEQDLTLDPSLIPPEPHDKLRVKFARADAEIMWADGHVAPEEAESLMSSSAREPAMASRRPSTSSRSRASSRRRTATSIRASMQRLPAWAIAFVSTATRASERLRRRARSLARSRAARC
jgi:hypothetical protein